ncbi:MAG: malonyl-ACP O-methyltransferase BioC [Rhodocyclaceae bacterium]|nr:malonyl-ACP O-methyltransferase BioC [Rhodocyclaceae bacterium]
MAHSPVRRAFERAAASYDAAADLQREVARRLALRLDRVLPSPGRESGRLLDAGSGTGFGASLLRARLPAHDFLELDLAPAMLKFARDRRAESGVEGCAGICADLEALPLAEACVDLVWSSLALQWAVRLGSTLAGLHRCLAPGGLLHFSTLGPGTLSELAASFAPVDRYRHVNRFTSPEEIRGLLVRAGFSVIELEQEKLVMEYEDVAGVLRGLKAIGARRVVEEGVPGLMGKHRWAQAVANYETRRRDGKLPATYEVIYVTASKGVGGTAQGHPRESGHV